MVLNGIILLEKNSVVNMALNPKFPQDTETLSVNINSEIRINQFIQNGLNSMSVDKVFSYSSYDNNCQYFILNLLHANGINNDDADSFIKQDTEYIFSNNPTLRKLANNITDTDGR